MFKKIKNNRILAFLLAFMMLLSSMPVFFEAQAGSSTDVDVLVSMQLDDSGLYMAKQEFTVAADLSETYGYDDEYEGEYATTLDALVAAHIAMFGDEDLGDYLEISGSAITLMAGMDAQNSFILVNGAFPGDDTVISTKLSDNDDVMFYLIQDTSYYSDIIAWFSDDNGEALYETTVKAGEAFDITLIGYIAMMAWYGDIEEHIEPIEDAQIVVLDVNEDAGYRYALFDEELGLTDEEGKLSITFNTPGTYILSAYDDSGFDMPFIASWLVVTVTEDTGSQIGDYEKALEDVLLWLKVNNPNPQISNTGGEWAVLALARGGEISKGDNIAENYLTNLDKAIEKGEISKYTDLERITLALSSLGIDASNYKGNNLTAAYKSFIPADDRNSADKTIMADIFALIALDSRPYPSEGNTRSQYVSNILSKALSGGGWNLTGLGNGDVDTTAMALQALAPYYGDTAVKTVADNALAYLSSRQNSDGTFTVTLMGEGSTASESVSQVIIALTALGRDPVEEAAFVKNGKNLIDALLGFQLNDGSFKHDKDDISENGIATEQAALALSAYVRFLDSEKTSLFDMSDAASNEIDKTALNNKITEAQALNPAYYTPASWASSGLTEAVSFAQEVLANSIASQTDIENAIAAINTAISKLITQADKISLWNEIIRAQSLNEADYTSSTWAVLLTKLANAIAQYEDQNASQAAVDLVKNQLTAAIEGLKASTGNGDIVKKRYATILVADPGAKNNQTSVYYKKTTFEISDSETAFSLLQKTGLTLKYANHSVYAGVYIQSINGFGEYSDGPLSGWVYSVNGTFPDFSSSMYTLNDGDVVRWLYSRNLGKDVSGTYEPPSNPGTGTNPNTDSGGGSGGGGSGSFGGGGSGGGGGSSGVASGTEAEGGSTAVAVDSELIKELIEESKTKGIPNIAVELTGNDDSRALSIDSDTLNGLRESGMSLTLKSDIADITLDAEILKTLTEGNGGEAVEITIKSIKDSELNDEQKDTIGDNPAVYLSISIGDKELHELGGIVTAVVPYTPPEDLDPEDFDLLTVYYLNEKGEITEMKGAVYSNGKITFTTNHFSVFFIGEWLNPFTDTVRGSWYYKPVRFVYGESLMTGTGEGLFSPNMTLTRAMLVQILYNNEERPEIETNNTFSDVKEEQWYTDAVTWASDNGIASGYGGGLFGPDDKITREQLVTLLYNYAKWKESDISKTSDLTKYTDISEIADYAEKSISWAVGEGLISGRTLTTLAPKAQATRAEAAALLQKFVQRIN